VKAEGNDDYWLLVDWVLRVLQLTEDEKNTDILLRFGQVELPNKSMN